MKAANTTLAFEARPRIDLAHGIAFIDEVEIGPHLFDAMREEAARYAVSVVDTRDKAIRAALIGLGWTPPPNKPQRDDARAVGEAAGERCLRKAEREAGFDGRGAAEFMRHYLGAHECASAEILTQAARLAGFQPLDDRAFGPVIAGMARRGEITQVGDCARARGHGTSGGRLWALSRAQKQT